MRNKLITLSLLKKYYDKFITYDIVMDLFKLNLEDAKLLIKELEEQGFILKSDILDENWVVSLKGKVQFTKKKSKLFNPLNVKKQISILISRVNTINKSDKYPFKISHIKLLDYLTEDKYTKQINIGYSLSRSYLTNDEFMKLCSGFKSNKYENFVESLFYPNEVIRSLLQGNCRSIKVKEMDEGFLRSYEGEALL